MQEDNTAVQQPTQSVSPVQFITTAAGSELVLSGPLAQAYSQGLQELYAKERIADGMALETQAMDVVRLQREFLIKTEPSLDPKSRANMGLFYGVQAACLNMREFVDIVDQICAMTETNCKKSVIVLDVKIEQQPGQAPKFDFYDVVPLEKIRHNTPLREALESFCQRKGVTLYHSLEEFATKHL
jgi:hypothetical protein